MSAAYEPPWWLPGGHLQTIYPALRPAPRVRFTRERWEAPDGDFVDVDWSGPADAARLLVLFHGLEGSSASHYARALAAHANRLGWRCAVPHFRGCSGEPNRLPRAYHSGDSAEIDWVLGRFGERHPAMRRCAAGVSLGGNALLKWLGERDQGAAPLIAKFLTFLHLSLLYRPRVLDAWIASYLQTASSNFNRKRAVHARNIYVPISVDVNERSVHSFEPISLREELQRRLVRSRLQAPIASLRMVSDPALRGS